MHSPSLKNQTRFFVFFIGSGGLERVYIMVEVLFRNIMSDQPVISDGVDVRDRQPAVYQVF